MGERREREREGKRGVRGREGSGVALRVEFKPYLPFIRYLEEKGDRCVPAMHR